MDSSFLVTVSNYEGLHCFQQGRARIMSDREKRQVVSILRYAVNYESWRYIRFFSHLKVRNLLRVPMGGYRY